MKQVLPKCLSWALKKFFFLKAVLLLQQNWQEGTEIPHIPPLPTCIAIIHIIHQGYFFFFLNQGWTTLTHHNHQSPQFTWGFTLMKWIVLHILQKHLDRSITSIHYYNVIQRIFIALKNFCTLWIFISLLPQTPGYQWPYCLCSFT